MPHYEFECPSCGHQQIEIRSMARRDEEAFCEGVVKSGRGRHRKEVVCGARLERRKIPSSIQLGKPSFVPAAILADGTKIPGHFGKDAPRKKPRWSRP